jgi:hypothetical protein
MAYSEEAEVTLRSLLAEQHCGPGVPLDGTPGALLGLLGHHADRGCHAAFTVFAFALAL